MQTAINFLIFVTVALGVGLGSAWYAVDNGIEATVRQFGPWVSWTAAGRMDADPYTRAHFARAGRLPITSTTARYYHADRDGTGTRLDSDCVYELVGRGPQADWWSLAAYDGNGQLMPNSARRYTISSSSVLRDNTGVYKIRVGREASSGNWLPIQSDYRFQLMLRVYRPGYVSEREVVDREAEQLPSIRKVTC